MSSYPQIKHLKCYFHVIKYCKDNLKRLTRAEQTPILADIDYLHSSSTEIDFNGHFEKVMLEWNRTVEGGRV